MERREFMLAVGGALACAGASPALAIGAGALPAGLNRAAFAALVGQSLITYDSARGVALTLLALKDTKAAPCHEQFTLLLSGSEGSPLKTGTYDVYHANIGTLPLFIETAGDGAKYRIQFSLLA
jgi:hypothetical protein